MSSFKNIVKIIFKHKSNIETLFANNGHFMSNFQYICWWSWKPINQETLEFYLGPSLIDWSLAKVQLLKASSNKKQAPLWSVCFLGVTFDIYNP